MTTATVGRHLADCAGRWTATATPAPRCIRQRSKPATEKTTTATSLVDEIPPLVSTNQHEFVFQGVRGGPAPAPQTLTISNAGCGPFTWTAAESAPWLTVSQTTGGSGGSTTLSTDTRGLATGVHRVTVTISAANDAGLDGSQVAVSLTVAADTTPPTGPCAYITGNLDKESGRHFASLRRRRRRQRD